MQGQSLGGVAVSLVNFFAALLKNPIQYLEKNCPGEVNTHSPSMLLRSLESDNHTNVQGLDSRCTGYVTIDWGIFIFFRIGSIILISCLIGFSWIDALRDKVVESKSLTVTGVTKSPRVGLELLEHHRHSHPQLHERHYRGKDTETTEPVRHATSHSMLLDSTRSSLLFDPALIPSSLQRFQDSDEHSDILSVLMYLRGPAACIFTTFVVTLSIFPVWTSELGSVRQCQTRLRLFNDLYTPFTFVLFNVGDFCGRLMAGNRFALYILHNRLVKVSLFRFLFFPLLLSCYSNSRAGLFFQIQSDVFSLFVQFAFAVTHGLLLSIAFAQGPTLLPKHCSAIMNDQMSRILNFAMALGLLCGSLCSFLVSRIA